MSWFDEQGTPPENIAHPGGTPNFDETAAGRNAPRVGVGGQGGYEPYSEAAFRAILESYPPTNDGIRAADAEAKRRFGPQAPELLEHPQRLDKFKMPDGRTFDVVGGAGGPNPTHAWMLEGPGHGGGGGTLGALAGVPGGAAGAVAADPSFAFRLGEGQKALERSAAAKGTLLTGGFAKALNRYAQDYASTEFQNIYNRQMGVANMGLNAAGQAAQAGSSYGAQVGAVGNNFANNQSELYTEQGNARAKGDVAASNIWGNTIGNSANTAGRVIADRNAPKPPTTAPPTGTSTGGNYWDDPAWLYN